MDKYIGNKKSIVKDLENFMRHKNINQVIFFDAFTRTTNVAQYFKQRGFDIIVSDINKFSKVLADAYIINNSFPTFDAVLSDLEKNFYFDYKIIDSMIEKTQKKILSNVIFRMDYIKKSNFMHNIIPLAKVIYYLNSLDIINFKQEENFFLEYYTVYGTRSSYKSLRGKVGKRNYFSEYNAKKLGMILQQIKVWRNKDLLSNMEMSILLASVIEEVTLIANVSGTFHDFNRNKLFPNALVQMQLRIPVLNIADTKGNYIAFNEDSNLLYKNNEYNNFVNKNNGIELLYIDPPYNFRQYTDYYHFLNLIAEYVSIEKLDEYGNKLMYVRGQHIENKYKSKYCFKDMFKSALSDLISNTNCKHVIVSYFDENNHWSTGKDINYKGREIIISSIKQSYGIKQCDDLPYIIKRKNYQSRNGANKKIIDELFFYGEK